MDAATRVTFLEGDRIYLRPLEESDANGPYPSWLNDALVCQGNSHHVYPYSRRQASGFIQHAYDANSDIILAIILKETDQHIGNIALQRINLIYRCADLSWLLGDQEQWGKGYGLEAGRLLLAHGFSALNLHRIGCATFDTNTAMRKLAQTLGMTQEGVRRQAAYKEGQYLDVVEFGILREEFERQPTQAKPLT